MHLRLPKYLLAIALAAFGASASSQTLPPGADCTEIPGTAPVLGAGRIVMVGEIHGTNEMPAEFLRLACSALQRGRAVSVGIEMVDPGGTLAAYLASTGDAASRQALLKARHWNGMRDGRSSMAWLGMIEAFRTMRQRGLPVSVFALNDQPFTGDRDTAMAARVREEHAAHPDALILAYTGNIHNMLTRVAGIPAPMGALAADMEPVSIVLTSDAGQAWMCTGPNECGATGLPATLENGPPHAARPAARAGVYTLQINVGRVTASPPAVPVAG